MDVDLLGNDEQASDAPLDYVDGSSEHKLTESLDGLHLSDNSHEGFGDFIQQTSSWKPWTSPPTGSSQGKRQSPPVALSLEKTEYSTAQVLLPHIPFDFIPPPPMSATPPRTTHVPSPIASVPISRQTTVQKREIVKSQLELTTDQVLDWLSPRQPTLKGDSVSVSINEAWENALGLMDGGVDQAGAHIAEVARRLCDVLDSFPVLSVGEPMVDVDISIDTDSLVESACKTSAGGPDKMQRGRRENNIDLRVAELVWPEFTYSSDDTTGKDESSSDNLVSAYLRLAEMTR